MVATTSIVMETLNGNHGNSCHGNMHEVVNGSGPGVGVTHLVSVPKTANFSLN